MRIVLFVALAVMLAATGCSRKGGVGTPSPGVTPTGQPSASAPAAAGGTATASPGAGGGTAAGGKNEAPPPGITRKQFDAISLTSIYDDLAKTAGSGGKLVKEENGKKTYEFAITDEPGHYAQVIYGSDGKISEKKVYKK